MNKEVIDKGMDLPEIIKARILLAQGIERNLDTVKQNLNAIIDRKTAEAAIYKLPRRSKGKTFFITGLSISIVKEIAREYGHLHYGWKEIERGATYSKCIAYCYDLKTNTSNVKEWYLKIPEYILSKANASEEVYKFLYCEGAKRERSCIEKILPTSLINFVYSEVEETIKGKALPPAEKKQDLRMRLASAVQKFQQKDDRITIVLLLDLLKKAREEDLVEEDIVTLIGVFNSINEGASSVEDIFPILRKKEPAKKIEPEEPKPKRKEFYKKLDEMKDKPESEVIKKFKTEVKKNGS